MGLGLQGKAALIAGASRGLGFAIADELAKEGANVSICARGSKDQDAAANVLKEQGVSVVSIFADVTLDEDVTRVVAESVAQLGHLDILVNNAGTGSMGVGIELTDEQWQSNMDRNLLSAVRFTRPWCRTCGNREVVGS